MSVSGNSGCTVPWRTGCRDKDAVADGTSTSDLKFVGADEDLGSFEDFHLQLVTLPRNQPQGTPQGQNQLLETLRPGSWPLEVL